MTKAAEHDYACLMKQKLLDVNSATDAAMLDGASVAYGFTFIACVYY